MRLLMRARDELHSAINQDGRASPSPHAERGKGGGEEGQCVNGHPAVSRVMQYAFPSLWLVFGLATARLTAAPLNFYVATNGNDRWSGRFAGPTANGQDGPLASLQRAMKAARLARQNPTNISEGINISMRGGVYELAEPLLLTPEDSGASAKQPFVIAAYPNEKPVISGGSRLRGWKRVENKPGFWETEVPEVRAGKWYFRSLFINGQRKQRARRPTQGFFRIQGASPQEKPLKLKFKPGEIKKEWAANGDVEVMAFFAWSNVRMQIRAVDEINHVATLSGNPRPSNQEANARYFVENVPEGVDASGEWYLNRKMGLVTYQAEAGEDLANAEVLAPRLNSLVVLKGDFAGMKPLQYIVLRGLAFSYTDWVLGTNGYADTQAAVAIHGDFTVEATVDCVVEDCTFSHLGGYAMEWGRGCQRNKVIGNEMFDLGAGGIRIGETAKHEQAFEQNQTQTVTDNHIHQAGVIYPPAVGVLILQSGHNRIAHNHIHDLFYTAISVGWNWGYQETACRDNRIEFNHLHDIGQFMLSDLGGIYTLGIQKGTVVQNNLIHDVNSFSYGGWGAFFCVRRSATLFS